LQAGRIVRSGNRGEVQIDTRPKCRFRLALQALIVSAESNVGTLLFENHYKPLVDEWYVWDSLEGSFQPAEKWDD